MNSISSESANSPRRRRWLSTAIKEPLRELSIQLSLLCHHVGARVDLKTAGVGDVLLDAAQDCTDRARAGTLLRAARGMGDALVERTIRDDAGARWRFLEHRQDLPLLPPGTSWMQGAAGIAAFLLRLARVTDDGLCAPVVDRPDQWWAVPAQLRIVQVGRDGSSDQA